MSSRQGYDMFKCEIILIISINMLFRYLSINNGLNIWLIFIKIVLILERVIICEILRDEINLVIVHMSCIPGQNWKSLKYNTESLKSSQQ